MALRAFALAATVYLAACSATTSTPTLSTTIADACAALAAAQATVSIYLAQHPTETKLNSIAADVALETGPACTAPYPSTDAQAIAAVAAGTIQLTSALAQP